MTGDRFRLDLAWRTDRGRVRERNEDAVSADADLGLVVIADGMGGAAGGEVASQMAVDGVLHRLAGRLGAGEATAEMAGLITDAVLQTNAELVRTAEASPALRGMGTTLVVGAFGPGQLVFGHVGDSRLYRWHGGRLEQLTRDHSLVQQAVDLGQFRSREAALRAGMPGNVITKALGNSGLSGPDTGAIPVEPGDIYLFCTDGLTNLVDDAVLADTLQSIDSSDEAADTLVQRARDAGGYDNITLVLARIVAV